MSATFVPWCVPRGNTDLSKHGDPVFPQFGPLNQNLSGQAGAGGGVTVTAAAGRLQHADFPSLQLDVLLRLPWTQRARGDVTWPIHGSDANWCMVCLQHEFYSAYGQGAGGGGRDRAGRTTQPPPQRPPDLILAVPIRTSRGGVNKTRLNNTVALAQQQGTRTEQFGCCSLL